MTAWVTDFAANTSLGNAVTACAAARAGLSRPVQLEQLGWDPEEGPVPLVGHTLRTAAGFQGEARLLALALPALQDLVRGGVLDCKDDVALFLALPDLVARSKAAETPVPQPVMLLDRLTTSAGLHSGRAARQVFPAGQISFSLAVQAAVELLGKGQIGACIVGVVDSLCDNLALTVLAQEERLKSPDMPVGLQPGEAAAFLLLESPERVRRRRGTARGSLTGVAIASDPGTKEEPPTGEGLTLAISQLVAATGPLPPGQSWFLLDRNGEVGRAVDWSCALIRLASPLPGVLPAPEWDLATSFGDTGAAAPALAVQAALQGFSRSYAPGRCAVVVSSSDDGGRSAVRVEKTS